MSGGGTSIPRSRIVLVHGASHGAWCWERLIPLLAEAKCDVAAPDLPGLGDDPAEPVSVGFDDYVARVVGTLRSDERPALLVGHSMGGGPISRAAEEVPERVGGLVYVAAFLPQPGETMAAIAMRENATKSLPMQPSVTPGAHEFDPARVRELFYGCCAPDIAEAAIRRLRPQATAPIAEPILLTADRWGSIHKSYVVCRRDGILSAETQRWMCARVDGVHVHELDTDHSPFYSKPEALAAILISEARLADARS